MADSDKAGQGASEFRAFLRSLPDDIQLAADRGLPVVLRLVEEPPGHVRKLMAVLGVPIEIGPDGLHDDHTDARRRDKKAVPVSRSSGRSTLTPKTGMVAQDYRASVARVFAREQNGDEALTCPSCGTETDVANVVHSPQCPVVTGASNGRAALEAMDAGTPQKPDITPDITPDIPEPDIAEPRAAPSPAGQPERTRGAGNPWTKEEIIDAIKAHAAEHGAPPKADHWVKGAPGRPTQSSVIKHFGSWSTAIEAAGFPRPTRGGHKLSERESTALPVSPPPPEVEKREAISKRDAAHASAEAPPRPPYARADHGCARVPRHARAGALT